MSNQSDKVLKSLAEMSNRKESHSIKVVYNNGDTFLTESQGTKHEIENHYHGLNPVLGTVKEIVFL